MINGWRGSDLLSQPSAISQDQKPSSHFSRNSVAAAALHTSSKRAKEQKKVWIVVASSSNSSSSGAGDIYDWPTHCRAANWASVRHKSRAPREQTCCRPGSGIFLCRDNFDLLVTAWEASASSSQRMSNTSRALSTTNVAWRNLERTIFENVLDQRFRLFFKGKTWFDDFFFFLFFNYRKPVVLDARSWFIFYSQINVWTFEYWF